MGIRRQRNPIGSAGNEGEPIGGRSSNEDALNSVLKVAKKGIGRRRRFREVGEIVIGRGGERTAEEVRTEEI